jgi:hypothetical protein
VKATSDPSVQLHCPEAEPFRKRLKMWRNRPTLERLDEQCSDLEIRKRAKELDLKVAWFLETLQQLANIESALEPGAKWDAVEVGAIDYNVDQSSDQEL